MFKAYYKARASPSSLNRKLFYFSIVLILVGLFFGIYLVAFFGFLLLLPALLATSRPPVRPSPAPAKQAPRRIIPAVEKKPAAVVSQAQPMPMPMATPTAAAVTSPSTTPQSYSSALFPAPLMPSLSLMGMGGMPQMAKESPAAKQEGRDELVEVGAILVLLKLFLG
jgi:hypothetical protein